MACISPYSQRQAVPGQDPPSSPAQRDPSSRVAASGMSDREPDSNDGDLIWKQRPRKSR